MLSTVDFWKKETEMEHQTWKCGFCGEQLKTWDVRAAHIVVHFREGLTMDGWGKAGLASSGPRRRIEKFRTYL